MKNIAILGASRAGKTTLARKINELYPRYHVINGDSIRNAFYKELPQNEINSFNGKGMKDDFARFSATLFNDEIERNEQYYNYIFDSCDVSVENAVRYFKNNHTIIVFLGYSELTEEEALENYRRYESTNDWTFREKDEQLLEHAKKWINNSRVFKKKCGEYKLRYVDTSFNRDVVLENLKEQLSFELNK